MSQIKSQADLRRAQKMKDQHERSWFANIEIRSGYPTGLIEAVGEWAQRAPMVPPQKYLKMVPDEPSRLFIDYDQWMTDLKATHDAYQADFIKYGRKIHGTEFDPGAPMSDEVQALLGPRPEPLEPVIAAKQGNGFILGTRPFDETRDSDVTLKAFFPEALSLEQTLEFGDFSDRPSKKKQPATAA